MKSSKICRLCLKVCKENVQPVEKITLLLVKMDLDISVNPVKCEECVENLQKCFEFKSVCIRTEKNVNDVLESSQICKINMTQVYLKDEKSNCTLSKLEEVCRFCTKPVMKFFSVNKLDEDINFSDMVQKFLPEVKLCVTNNPVCCSNCLNSLKSYFAFLKNCQDVEEQIKMYCKVENITKGKVKLSNVSQYMSKHVLFEHNAEKDTSSLKKDTINEIIETEDQSIETYSLNPLKTEIIVKEEEIIEINSVDLIDMDTIITEKQLVETFSADDGDTKKCNMVKSNKDLLLEEKVKENYGDDEFSEDCSDENNTEDVNMAEIKIEDIDIKPNNFNMDRCLLMKPTETNENSSDVDSCPEDIVKVNNSKTNISDFVEGDDERKDSIVSSVKQENIVTNISRKTNMVMKELVVRIKRENFYRYEEKPKKLQCSYCNYKSSFKSNLAKHLKTIHGKHLLSCHHCGYKTLSKDFLKKHQVIHGDSAKFKCPQCEKVFKSKVNIENHFLMKHDSLCDIVTSKIHSCNICSFRTTVKLNLFHHINTKHSRLEKYQCSYCSRTFVLEGALKRHISAVHLNIRSHVCNGCKKTFNVKSLLDSHIVSHHPKNLNLMKTVTNKIKYCDHCTFKSIKNSVMMSHIKTHGILLMSCQHCSYKTDKEDCLKKHQVTHNNAKFKCPQCQKLFTSKLSIDNHFLIRHDNLCDLVTSKIHSCNICSFKTTMKSEIFDHINRKHSRLKKYQCNYCLHISSQKHHLKQHILSIHLNLRPYICEGCEKTFKQKQALNGHIVSHHHKNLDLMKTVTNKIYNCDHCSFKSTRNKTMKDHVKTHGKHV